jgi:hypothetical protein
MLLQKLKIFLNYFLEKENDKIQLNYGPLIFLTGRLRAIYFKYRNISNYFLKNRQEGKFTKEIELTNNWLDELSNQLIQAPASVIVMQIIF